MHKLKNEIDTLRPDAIKTLDSFIESLRNSNNKKTVKKAKLLSYWIKDYVSFIKKEDNFDYASLKKYKRGEIIKAHLGVKVGREEGGLHYCLVIENDNPLNSPILTVIPLTSVKPDKDISNLKPYEIFLGNEIFRLMLAKISVKRTDLNQAFESMKNDECKKHDESKLEKIQLQISEYEKLLKEILKMKSGSIALIKQITTISKLRIYNPKRYDDALAKIKISDELLDKIDASIIKFYTNCVDTKEK